jgi:hypothetical protein
MCDRTVVGAAEEIRDLKKRWLTYTPISGVLVGWLASDVLVNRIDVEKHRQRGGMPKPSTRQC